MLAALLDVLLADPPHPALAAAASNESRIVLLIIFLQGKCIGRPLFEQMALKIVTGPA